METLESVGEVSLGFPEIETTVQSLSRSDIFHIAKEVLGFILYMHQQIPVVLQHLEHEFDVLKEDYKQLVSQMTEVNKDRKASFQRKTNMRKIEVKSSIKRLEKFMKSIAALFSALQEAIEASPSFHGVTFLLGGSLVRPQYVYEILFSHFRVHSHSAKDNIKSKVAELLSRKAVRWLISNDAGSSSFAGPTKLVMMIKCASTFSSPLHFLPKREFSYNKKVLPIKLHIKSKSGDQAMNILHYNSEQTNCSSSAVINENDVIWYQCRHIVKGIAVKSQETES